MSKITTLFIDKGGVLVDNAVLSTQYRRLLGEFLPRELGGDSAAWANANMGAADRAFARYLQASRFAPPSTVADWFSTDARRWLYEMCDEVGRPRPDEKDADRIAAAAHRYVQRNVDVHAPEIVRRLRELKGRGLTLHLASGDHHEDLFGYLETMGIVELFDRLYGSDLVNMWKSSADYYRAILRDACVAPTTAVVIDDSERAIGWAAECGLRGVLVRRGAGEPFEDAVLRAFDSIEPLLS